MGRCMASEPRGFDPVCQRASTVSLHRLEQLHVAVEDNGSEGGEYEQTITRGNHWYRCISRLAGHLLSA